MTETPTTGAALAAGGLKSLQQAPGTATLRLRSREEVADGVVRLTFEDPGGHRLPPWTPGSHIDVILPAGTVRQYSLCGDRYDGFCYQVAVLDEPDGRGGSRWIHEHAQQGDVFQYGGPRNQFPLVPAGEYLFVAGGIGITALVPMIEQARHTGTPWRLLYGGRCRSSMAFADQLTQRFPDHVVLAPHNEMGNPDIAGWLGSPHPDARVYTCGPPGLIEAVQRASSDWPPYSVHSERFVAAVDNDAANRPFDIELARSNATLRVSAGQSILDALSAAGQPVLSSCRQGTCGTCEVSVLAGAPDHRDSVLNDADRKAGDCIITCVSRALYDHLVLDI